MAVRTLVGELDVAYSSPAEFAEITLSWLRDGVESLGHDMSEEILSGPPLVVSYIQPNPDEGLVTQVKPPLWGEVHIVYGGGKFYNKPYSRTSLKRLEKLAPELQRAEVWLYRVAGDTVLSSCFLEVEREGDEQQGHARLMIYMHPDSGGDYAADRPEITFMNSFAVSHAPVFGHVSFAGGALSGETDLERALLPRGWDPLREWDRYLRGYSWITVIPAVLALRVGGAENLRKSGSFVVVEELPDGGVWLEATRRWSEYIGERIERVFETLAPVISPGMPEKESWDTKEYRLSWRDAADFQPAK